MQLKKTRKPVILTIVAAVLVVGLVGVAAYFAKNYYDLRANPEQATEAETKQLTERVGQLYQLPAGETPIVGEVRDKAKLQNQEFFKNADNGDKLLIYQKARLAIVYRQQDDKLINVGPITLQDDNAAGSGQAPRGQAGPSPARPAAPTP